MEVYLLYEMVAAKLCDMYGVQLLQVGVFLLCEMVAAEVYDI